MVEGSNIPVLDALNEIPLLDAHTHLVDRHLGAKGLHDILLYHMSISEIHAAGCPSGERLTAYPAWPDEKETRFRLIEAIPYLGKVRNTSINWGIRAILSELYDWNETITLDNWQRLDAMIRNALRMVSGIGKS